MRRNRKAGAILLAVILLLGAAAVYVGVRLYREASYDPHAGQVLVNDGFNDVWITPIEGVEVNDLKEEDFENRDGFFTYTGDSYETVLGVDVSEHQHEIDWSKAAESGVGFAYIRSGYRGWTQGGLYEDAWFRRNIEGARAAGLDVGVYFYSQAINVAEAIEEANFVLDQIRGYDVSLPIIFDWEIPEDAPEARTNGLDPAIIADCCVAFCETVKAAGYDAGIYFNLQLGYYSVELDRLTDFDFWIADWGSEYPKFYYAFKFWQYSRHGEIPGIEGEVDLNLMFIKVEAPEQGKSAS